MRLRLARPALHGCAFAFLGAMYVFLFLPVLILVAYSFQAGNVPFPPLTGPSFKWYGAAMANAQYMDGLLHSLAVGALSALVATLLGFLAAYGVARFAFRLKGFVQALLLAPSMLSFLIIALGLLVFFKSVGIEPSLLAIGIGHVVINLPICFAVILAQIGAHQVSAERAARDLGASETEVLVLITAPMIWPGLLTAYLLAFSFSWDEFIIAFMLSRFETTLPVALWSSLRAGLSPAVNAAGTLLFLGSLGLYAVLISAGFRRREVGLGRA